MAIGASLAERRIASFVPALLIVLGIVAREILLRPDRLSDHQVGHAAVTETPVLVDDGPILKNIEVAKKVLIVQEPFGAVIYGSAMAPTDSRSGAARIEGFILKGSARDRTARSPMSAGRRRASW
jgi:hypothetical protein